MPTDRADDGSDPVVATLELRVDGVEVSVPDDGSSLLAVLRERLGRSSPKDGCSPQGQCGCCTVLVDGAPRVACVTPARRVAGREIVTAEGLDPAVRDTWAEAFAATGGSQCGFCTPGIVCRLVGLRAKDPHAERAAVDRALAAHLCRCTGWQTIREAWALVADAPDAGVEPDAAVPPWPTGRDPQQAARRAEVEGASPQRVAPGVALGHGGFADDTAPAGALVAVPDGDGGWAVGATLAEARALSGKVQGRRPGLEPTPPLELPDGTWALALRTSWVEPAYLETDASWCEPGGEPRTPLANGGAFGAKRRSVVTAAARELADRHGRPVRVLLSREDTVRLGPKRPPIAAGVRADGTGVVRVVRTTGWAEQLHRSAPALGVEEVDVPGPPTSTDLRGAGWVEGAVLLAALERRGDAGSTGVDVAVTSPDGGRATAAVLADGTLRVAVDAGTVLDPVVLRSYVIGATHMAYGWVTSEGLAVDDEGSVASLTVRSFGVVRPADSPEVDVVLHEGEGPPVNGSDAAFAAVAAAVWLARGLPSTWPTG
jgi:xanthine dehydrogenase small subunit